MSFFDFGEVINSDTQFVVFGIPWDFLSSIDAVNSAVAPNKIRAITDNLALTTEMGFEIPKLKVVDIGDVKIKSKDVEKNLGPHKRSKIKCDLSKTYGSGTFVYYIMYFDEVSVDKDAAEGKDIEIEKNVMDLNIIKGMDKLLERTKVIRKKIESQGAWS